MAIYSRLIVHLARIPRSRNATGSVEPFCVRASRIDDACRGSESQKSLCAAWACSKLQRGGFALDHRRSVLSRLDHCYVSAQLGTAKEDVTGMCHSAVLACLHDTKTPGWFASKPIQVLRKTVTRRLVFGLRLLLPFSSSPFVWPPGIHAHDSYPCAAQEHSHEANGSNRRKVPCPRLQGPSPGHLSARPGREERSAFFSSPPCAGYPVRSICSKRRAPPFGPFVLRR
jgi:hypothetical protein